MYIFNFHHVEKKIKHVDRKHITMTPAGLRQCIRFLRFLGYEIVSLRETLTPNHSRQNQVAITFDDGYENFFTEALPVLMAENCPATVFVLAGQFSGSNDWDQAHMAESHRDKLMSETQLNQLSQYPLITIGSHGLFHRHLPSLPEEEQVIEMFDSHAILQDQFTRSYIPVLAFPWGAYNQKTLELLKTGPYQLGMTTKNGRWDEADSSFEIPRYSVFYRDRFLPVFILKLLRHRVPLWGYSINLMIALDKHAFGRFIGKCCHQLMMITL